MSEHFYRLGPIVLPSACITIGGGQRERVYVGRSVDLRETTPFDGWAIAHHRQHTASYETDKCRTRPGCTDHAKRKAFWLVLVLKQRLYSN